MFPFVPSARMRNAAVFVLTFFVTLAPNFQPHRRKSLFSSKSTSQLEIRVVVSPYFSPRVGHEMSRCVPLRTSNRHPPADKTAAGSGGDYGSVVGFGVLL